MPQQGIPKQDSSMHHPLSDISTPPFFHPLPPFRLPPFPKAPLPMLLANRHQQSSCKKNSMKSKLFGNKPPLPHRHPNRTPACTTLSDIHPTFLHPSSFPPSSFSQGATSHALGKQTLTQPFQKA